MEKPTLAWAGFESEYEKAGFVKLEQHWLSKDPSYTRWIYRTTL